MGKTRYDYRLLIKHPGICAFLIGWTAERITCLTHYALYTSNYHEWRKARWELHRLVAICMEIEPPPGNELGSCVGELLRFFGKDGFWTTTEAQSLRIHLHDDEPCGEMRGDGYPFGGYQWDTRFFPTLFCSPDELKDQMVSAPATGLLANLTRLLGKSFQKENAVAFGVNMAGLAYGRCTRDIQRDTQEILSNMLHDSLITRADHKDLLDIPARNALGIGRGPLLPSGYNALLLEEWTGYRERKLAKILNCICAHAGMRAIPATAIDTKRPPSKRKLAILYGPSEAGPAGSGQVPVQPPGESNRSDGTTAKSLDQTNPPAVADTRSKKPKRTTQKVDFVEKTAERLVEKVVDGLDRVVQARLAGSAPARKHRRGGTRKRKPGCKGISGDEDSFRLAVLSAWERARETGVVCKTFAKEYKKYIFGWIEEHSKFDPPEGLTDGHIDKFQKWQKARQKRQGGKNTAV